MEELEKFKWKNEGVKGCFSITGFLCKSEIYRNVETCVLKLPMFWKKAADVFSET